MFLFSHVQGSACQSQQTTVDGSGMSLIIRFCNNMHCIILVYFY
jgi:hypothetical protein